MQPGDTARVLDPFADVYPDRYTVAAIHEDGTVSLYVPGFETPRDFAPAFVEKV